MHSREKIMKAQSKGHTPRPHTSRQESLKEIRRTCKKNSDTRYGSRLTWMTAEKNIILFYHSNFCGFLDRNHIEK